MEGLSILNRIANFNPNSVQRITAKNNIFTSSKYTEEKINAPFEKLRTGDKSISNYSDLEESSKLVKKENLAKMRVLTKQENSGFVLIGSLTFMGIAVTGSIIFMLIKTLFIK